MFNHNARSDANRNLDKLFNKELTVKRNLWLCLVAIALVIGGSGGCMASKWLETKPPVVDEGIDRSPLAAAAVMPTNVKTKQGEVVPTSREELISKVWACQLSWQNKIDKPETMTTEQLEQLHQQCLNARGGGGGDV